MTKNRKKQQQKRHKKKLITPAGWVKRNRELHKELEKILYKIRNPGEYDPEEDEKTNFYIV